MSNEARTFPNANDAQTRISQERESERIYDKSEPLNGDTRLPVKVNNILDFSFIRKNNYRFLHAHTDFQTHIMNLNFIENKYLPLHIKEDLARFKRITDHFFDHSYNANYRRRFLQVQILNSFEKIKDESLVRKYQEFIQEIFDSVYSKFYESFCKDTRRPNTFIEFPDIDDPLTLQNLLYLDFYNKSTVMTVLAIYQTIDSILDNDEVNNCFILNPASFYHPINMLLSPTALALSFFHFQTLSLKKHWAPDCNYYNKKNLPKTVYINLTGFFSEIEADILHHFSDTIFTVFVYDDSTGGPAADLNNLDAETNDLRTKKRRFQTISDNLLLVPLQSSNKYSPYDILSLFDTIIMRAVEKVKPAQVIISCSMLFEPQENLPFWLDQNVFSQIVHTLAQISDYKVIISPFKIPNMKEEKTRTMYDKILNHYTPQFPENQKDRLSGIMNKYGVPYHDLLLRDGFVSSIEALSGCRDQTLWNENSIKSQYGISAHTNQLLYQLGRRYKHHQNFNTLYSKNMNLLARAATGIKTSSSSSNTAPAAVNTVNLVTQDGNVVSVELEIPVTEELAEEVELDGNCQYYIDYSDMSRPLLILLNAKVFLKNERVLKETISHLVLRLNYDPTKETYAIEREYEELPKIVEVEHDQNLLRHSGICKVGNYFFRVYGTGKERDTTNIYCYDLEKKIYYQIKRKNTPSELLQRHAVACCAFVRDKVYYLYVFGGQIQPNTRYKDKIFSEMDIIDIIEVYKTQDPSQPEWEYQEIPKQKSYQKVSFIPFRQSYAVYHEKKNAIFLMGGKTFENSVNNFNFPVFVFSLESRSFASFEVFLNDMKDNTERKIVGNAKRNKHLFPVVVSENNYNVRFIPERDVFQFVLSHHRENCAFLYDYQIGNEKEKKEKACRFEGFSFLEEDNKPKDLKQVKYLEQSYEYAPDQYIQPAGTRLTALIKYFFPLVEERRVLYKIVQWAENKKGFGVNELLSLVNLMEANKEEANARGMQPFVFEKMRVLVKRDDFQETLQQQGQLYRVIKVYLEESFDIPSFVPPEWRRKEENDTVAEVQKQEPLEEKPQLEEKEEKEEAEKEKIVSQDKKEEQKPDETLRTLSQASTQASSVPLRGGPVEEEKVDYSLFSESDLRLLSMNSDKLLRSFSTMNSSKSLSMKSWDSLNLNEDTKIQLEKSQNSLLQSIRSNSGNSEESKLKAKDVLHSLKELFPKDANITYEEILTLLREINESNNESPGLKKEESLSSRESPTRMMSESAISRLSQNEENKEEEKNQTIEAFHKCLKTENSNRVFFNANRSEVIIALFGNQISTHRLRLKVAVKDQESKSVCFEDLSFEQSPSCVTIFQNAIICYIDGFFKTYNLDIYEQYKKWILFADLGDCIRRIQEGIPVRQIVFKKLFQINHNDHILNRCLLIQKENLHLFGGKHYRFKGNKNVVESKDVSIYNLGKLVSASQMKTSSEFRDNSYETTTEKEVVAVGYEQKVYLCKKESPIELEIFDCEESEQVEFPGEMKKMIEKTGGYQAHLNLINYQGKPMVLITFLKQDKAFEFLLFDIQENEFVEGKVSLVVKNAKDEKFAMVYTRFEQLESNVNDKPLDSILIYLQREEAKVMQFEVQIKD